MGHNDIVTRAFRHCAPYISSTYALADRARDEFGTAAGRKELELLLGILHDRVDLIFAEIHGVEMSRLAFHYGFMPCDHPEHSNSWQSLPMLQQPFDVGPRMRWSRRKIGYVHDVLTGKGTSSPSAEQLGWRMDTTADRLRDALRRRGMKLRA